MKQIRTSILLKGVNSCIAMMTPRVVIFVIFVVHVILTGSLSNSQLILFSFDILTYVFCYEWTGAEAVFVTMTIFNNLRFTMSYCFQQSVALSAELYVSCKRIQVNFVIFIINLLINFCLNWRDIYFWKKSPKNRLKIQRQISAKSLNFWLTIPLNTRVMIISAVLLSTKCLPLGIQRLPVQRWKRSQCNWRKVNCWLLLDRSVRERHAFSPHLKYQLFLRFKPLFRVHFWCHSSMKLR